MKPGIAAVLFDLDGTLVDSAPDLAGAANDLLLRRGMAPVPYLQLRPHAGSGARGMLGVAFGLAPGQPGYDALRAEFLDHYATRLLQDTRPFEQALEVLDLLDHLQIPWGIVTNKALHLAEPVVRAFGWHGRSSVLVGGDSTPHTKPHPGPLLEAARRLGQPPRACVYVGDDPRDMRAGRAADMGTLAAAWGYLGPDAPPHAWEADAVLPEPRALLQWLEVA